MTISQMQNKYDIIAQEIKYEEVKMFNEDGDGTHTPTVYEYVKFSIDNGEGFLCWLLDDGNIESKYDLSDEQQEELDEFIEFCIPDEPVDIEECYHDKNEHAFMVKDVYGKTYDVSYDEAYSCDNYYSEDDMRGMLRIDYNLSDSAIEKVIATMHCNTLNSPLVDDKRRMLEEVHLQKEGIDFRFDENGTLLRKHYDFDGNECWA